LISSKPASSRSKPGRRRPRIKIEGKKAGDNEDGIRRVYHVYTWLELDDDAYTKGEMAPYILMIDDQNSEVIGLYRNWEEGDETMAKLIGLSSLSLSRGEALMLLACLILLVAYLLLLQGL
jgi:hypothetical protein